MNKEALIQKILKINTWKSNGKRAAHKPLMLLYALSQFFIYEVENLEYRRIHGDLKHLLLAFGQPVKYVRPQYPFIRLINDGFWEVDRVVDKMDVSKKWLIDNEVKAGFNGETLKLLKENPGIVYEIIKLLLEEHFPKSYHEDILAELGFNSDLHMAASRKIRTRDPLFRHKILAAYNNSCAICGYSLLFDNNPIGVEAAHIMWHQAGGPSSENNGIALCSIHHKLFDRGMYTLDCKHRVKVSTLTSDSNSAKEWLWVFNNKRIIEPSNKNFIADDSFVEWHMREVFRGEMIG